MFLQPCVDRPKSKVPAIPQVRFARIRLERPPSDNMDPKEVLKYRPPRTLRPFQSLMMWVNRNFLMRGLDFKMPRSDVDVLRSIPRNAGNVLILPHPEMDDGFVLLRLFDKAERYPAGILMASEEMEKRRWIIPFLQNAGVIAVRRGKPNPEAIEYLVNKISKGGWGGLAPEGSVYYTREVMPMEQGAFKIALEAALKSIRNGWKRPVYLTPTAHAYFYKDPKAVQAKMLKALGELEAHPNLFGVPQSGTPQERVDRLGHRVLDYKARYYSIPSSMTASFSQLTRKEGLFKKAAILKAALLADLEKRYFGKTGTGFERRRAMKLRMAVMEKMTTATPTQKTQYLRDLQQATEVIYLIPLHEHPADPYDDPYTRSQYVRRYGDQMDIPYGPFGDRDVVVRVLKPLDMRPLALEYAQLKTDKARHDFLVQQTEQIRSQIQAGVMAILAARKHRPQ